MSLQMLKSFSKPIVSGLVPLLFVTSAVWGQSTDKALPTDHQVVVLLDINPHQKKVLPLELALAQGIIQKLDRAGYTFFVITFGSTTPTLLKAGISADEAIAAVHDVTVEETKDKYFSVHFYDAMDLALRQFRDDGQPKTLLIISEGNDYFPHKTFKETVRKARQLGVSCDAAMVADHTLYGTKAIQRYGFYVRELAGKTHGQYIEVGGKQKKIARSVERFSEGILSRRKN